MPDRSHKVSARRRRLAALLGVFGLALIAAAPASAQEEILGAASYPDMTTYQCRTDAITIYPGQNLNLFGLTKTCPNASQGQRPRRRHGLRPRLHRRGLRHPLPAEHGRGQGRTASS